MKMRVHIFFTSSTSSTAVAIGKATIINGLLPQNSLTYLLGLKLLPRFAKVASKVQELAPRANILLGTYLLQQLYYPSR